MGLKEHSMRAPAAVAIALSVALGLSAVAALPTMRGSAQPPAMPDAVQHPAPPHTDGLSASAAGAQP